MGRKTYLSLPNGALPNRTNVVLSRNDKLQLEGCLVFPSLDAALVHLRDEEEVFIIGGGELYRQALPIADKLYLTKVHAAFPDADTFFPAIHYNEWNIIAQETVPANEKDACDSTFYEYERK
jgi:dihydrofolate reductase